MEGRYGEIGTLFSTDAIILSPDGNIISVGHVTKLPLKPLSDFTALVRSLVKGW
jgi:hypothetical protein